MDEIYDKLFSERLSILIKNSNYILSDMEDSVGKRAATISRYASGEIKGVKRSTIVKLANFFKVNPAWLAGLSDEKYIISKNNTSDFDELLINYSKLNNDGKQKAIDYVKDLTDTLKYTEKRDESKKA